MPQVGRAVLLAALTALVPLLADSTALVKWQIPGGSAAVIKVLAHGYCWADREYRTPGQPDPPSRVASLTKSLTSAAVSGSPWTVPVTSRAFTDDVVAAAVKLG